MHISATCSYESILQDAKDVLLPKCNRHSNAKILSQKKNIQHTVIKYLKSKPFDSKLKPYDSHLHTK